MSGFLATNLFELARENEPKPDELAKAHPSGQVGKGHPGRYYQMEDVAAIDAAHEMGKRKVLAVAATGLGKGWEMAELIARNLNRGNALILEDSKTLVGQIADEIEFHLKEPVGRVMDGNAYGLNRRVIVATVQGMYTPNNRGRTLLQEDVFRADRFSHVIADECESFLAPIYRTVPDHFLSCERVRMAGFTATPKRGDAVSLDTFYDYSAKTPGPLLRTTRWAVADGWLTPAIQINPRFQLDTSSVSLVRREDGTEDFSNDALAQAIQLVAQERHEVEFARAILSVAGDQQGLIFSPARVAAAKSIVHWVNSARKQDGLPAAADVIWGTRRDSKEVVERFKRKEFQLLASVNQLTKGFDYADVPTAYVCRPTRIWRLLAQIVGRVFRPHSSIRRALNDAADAQARRALIAGSPKPEAIVALLVGMDPDLLDADLVDVLAGEEESTEVVQRAKRIMHRQIEDGPVDPQKAIAEAKDAIVLEQKLKLEEQARLRQQIKLQGTATVEGRSDVPEVVSVTAPRRPASRKQMELYVALAKRYAPDHARRIAEAKEAVHLTGMIGSLMRQKIKPDYRRVDQAWRSAPAAPSRPVATGSMQTSEWQIGQLSRLGYRGQTPVTYAEASSLIRQLSQRRAPEPVGVTEGVF